MQKQSEKARRIIFEGTDEKVFSLFDVKAVEVAGVNCYRVHLPSGWVTVSRETFLAVVAERGIFRKEESQ